MDALQGMKIINSQGRLFRFLKIMRKKKPYGKKFQIRVSSLEM